MKNQRKKAFTLVELMIVIIIIWLMALLSYAPYNLYQKKAQLRVASREVSQALYESKNMAVSGVEWIKNWTPTEKENKVVILHLNSATWQDHKIDYYLDEFNKYQENNWEFKSPLNLDLSWLKKEKTKDLQKWILIKDLKIWSSTYKEIAIIYAAASWNIKILWKDSSSTNFSEITWDKLEVIISYGDTDSDFLKKTLTYYLKTNIVDYSK